MAKINCRFTMKRSVVLLGDTPREKWVFLFILLWWIPHSGWIFIYSLGWDSPSSYIIELLLNLNEIYIRNSPHCLQNHCSWPEHRASKHELLLKIYTLYITSQLLRWLGRLLTFLRVNCNFWFVVTTTKVIFNIQVRSWPWMCSRDLEK